MEHWLIILTILLLLGAVCALPASAAEQWKELQAGVAIPMRDGRALIADVYLPQQPGAYPCVLIQTPYGRDRFGPAMPAIGTGRDDGLLDRTRYACVIVDWRGFFDSAPAGDGIARPRYGQDGHDVVEWIARQPWSNGKVGTWGPSALGRVQYWTARTRPPHLTCCMPLVAADGPVYDEYYENGVYREAHVKIMERLGFPISEAAAAATRPNSLIYRLTARLDDPRCYQVPFQIMTGWYDPGVTAQIRAFEKLHTRAEGVTRAYSKLIIGPWHHTGIGMARQGALAFPGAVPERDHATRLFLDYWS
ncbi:MAG TPA: CocE/NonD family hydrolase, partial [Armatimonadota bacterium]|nr:CocE/NonD family hydrolase [Armatimonadota bacterium]